ncbi:MAG: Rne/Rng family ribonuclease [Micavibrio sp.]
MPKTMLIDATHAEETRVAVVDGHRLVEYDYESKVRKQLKGSVFLAKVTRVEPSLQAAFVNFGGNRHGFLPFSEIHPDYFRIPIADREALIAAQQAELEEHDEEMEQAEAAIEQQATEGDGSEEGEEEEDELEPVVEVGGDDQPFDEEGEEEAGEDGEAQGAAKAKAPAARADAKAPVAANGAGTEDSAENGAEEGEDSEEASGAAIAMRASSDIIQGPAAEEDDAEGDHDFSGDDHGDEDADMEGSAEDAEAGDSDEGEGEGEGDNARSFRRDRNRGRNNSRGGRGGRGRRFGGRHSSADRDDRSVDTLGGDGVDGDRPFRYNLRKSYKIQEVIKRGQIMLIQVSKEERGNKGAAVTTYLSMPGRYCVLMPNSPRGGGVSRKIAAFKDRKRMKEILDDLSVPEGMSVILRTAGVARTKVEIKRDLDYLTRLWNTIREHTLQSTAPALIYEEGNLIKRAIRDLYSRDIEDVHVSGEGGYKAAKEFMKMLMPSHAKKVQEYKDQRVPMFYKFGVENQIADIGEPVVNLKSGGYLVINPTEALVSVDVNSGRATKERHIEETALKTNLEAADEVARQLRLRDLGGLVVVDFIDMEDRRNNRKVEQRLRDALSNDRARIQVGRISSFGLLELSRQRLNPSLAEAQQEICPHCAGTGRVKTLDFSAITIVRALEAEGVKGKNNDIIVTLAPSVAMYVLNNKRGLLADIESRYGFTVRFETDETLSTSQFTLEACARAAAKVSNGITSVAVDDYPDDDSEDEADRSAGGDEDNEDNNEQRDRSRRRGRRGGRGRGRGRERDGQQSSADDNGNDGAARGDDESGDSAGNRSEAAEDDADDDRGNRAPREENGEGEGRSRRGGRNRREGRSRNQGGRSREDGGQADEGAERAAPAARPQPSNAASPLQTIAARASNDTESAPVAAGAEPSRDYETVNQAPEKKKRGWWNKLIE